MTIASMIGSYNDLASTSWAAGAIVVIAGLVLVCFDLADSLGRVRPRVVLSRLRLTLDNWDGLNCRDAECDDTWNAVIVRIIGLQVLILSIFLLRWVATSLSI